MAFCSNCGQMVADTAQFCSSCGNSLNSRAAARRLHRGVGAEVAQQPAAEALSEQSSGRGLNDVPWWLGWLGILLGVTTIGLIVYCIWACRRGRREGVGRGATEHPYEKFGWRVAGWWVAAQALLVIILLLPSGLGLVLVPALVLVLVHLPTLCYKHGLRVGAGQVSVAPTFASLTALAGAVGAIVLVIALTAGSAALLSAETGSEDDSLEPVRQVPAATQRPARVTPSGPFLTGAEAAGKVEADLRGSSAYQELVSQRGGVNVLCDDEAYNQVSESWIVLCLVTVSDGGVVTFRAQVNDRTGAVSEIR